METEEDGEKEREKKAGMQQETGRKETGSEERGDRLGGKPREKGGEKGVLRMGEGSRAPPSHTPLWIPLEALQALGASILGVWRKKGSAFGQGGRERVAGNHMPLESRPPSTSWCICLQKYPCYTERYNYNYNNVYI